MAERNEKKERKCDTCGKKIQTTAAGIKEHQIKHKKGKKS
jgi:hypothetical protein